MKLTRKALATVIALSVCSTGTILLTGCKDGVDDVVSKVSTVLKAQGREYDNLISGGIGDTLSSAFFDFTVNSATIAETYADYLPNTEGYVFLVVDVTTVSTFDNPIPVGNYDFIIAWGAEEAEQDIAFESFSDEMYPDEVTIEKGEKVSGAVVFEVPPDEKDFSFIYEEFYEDEFVGNTCSVDFTVS